MKIVIRNDEKKDKAVSAIIGTILIVAITVVLAATLYAVLGGFGGLIGKPTPTASMSISESGTGSSGSPAIYTLTFTSVSANISLKDVILRVTEGSSTFSSAALSTAASAIDMNSTTLTVEVTQGGVGYLTYDTVIQVSSTQGALSSIAVLYTVTGGNIAGPETV